MSALGLVYETSLQRKQRRFLECFANCCNVLQASRWAKVDRTAHYRWLEDDPTYPARFRAMMKRATRTLEDEAVTRAREGLHKPVLYKGKQVYVDGRPVYERVCSDSILMFLLKAYDRERFGDKSDHTFKWDGNPESLTDEQRRAFEDYMISQAIGSKEPAAIEAARKQIEAEAAAAVDVEAQPADNNGEEPINS